VSYNELQHQTDRQLVERVLQGDRHAFGAIITGTERLVAQIVQRMVFRAEDRKDLVQDIYLKAFRHLGGFRFDAKLSTWIANIAYHTCINFLEKKKILLTGENYEHLPETGAAEQSLQGKELSGIINAAIDELPPVYKTIFVLFHKEELSISEICNITSMPEGTVKSHLFRARKQLKQIILSRHKKDSL